KVWGGAGGSTIVNPCGTGSATASSAMQYCAYPPPGTSAATSSPTRQRVTLSPMATTLPAISSPGISGAPGGGGYWPLRCMTSGRVTPAAATLTSISLGPGGGTGRSSGTGTSGPPGALIPMAVRPVGE